MDLSWLLPEGKGVPVLMYHKVWSGICDHLTITPERLREQWEYLKNAGFHTLSLLDYLAIAAGTKPKPDKAILITFDDGYVNNLTYAYPLLQELGWQATFFIIGATLNNTYRDMGHGPDLKMTLEQLRMLDTAVVQLAMHGYHHLNMADVPVDDSLQELQEATAVFKRAGLSYHMVWAYAYGGRPRSSHQLALLKQRMKEEGITAAFRIGNRVSQVPALDPYELTRIDIKGTDTLKELGIKLRKGKMKPF